MNKIDFDDIINAQKKSKPIEFTPDDLGFGLR
jgi:hypothetical protein